MDSRNSQVVIFSSQESGSRGELPGFDKKETGANGVESTNKQNTRNNTIKAVNWG